MQEEESMKKVLQVLCCIGIFASSLGFTLSLCGKSFVNDVLVSATINEIDLEERTNAILESSALNIDEATNAKLKEVSNDVVNDEKVQAKIHEFVSIAVQDIVQNETNGDVGALDEAMKEKILSYSDVISEATNNQMSESEVKSTLTKILDANSIDLYYSDLMNLVQADYSDSEVSMIKTVNSLQGSPLFYGSLFALIILSIVVFLLSEYKSRGLLALGITYIPCAIVTLISLSAFGVMMSAVLKRFSTEASVNLLPMQVTAGVYVILAIACFVASNILSKKEM